MFKMDLRKPGNYPPRSYGKYQAHPIKEGVSKWYEKKFNTKPVCIR